MSELIKDMVESANRAVEENVRHSRESLWEYLDRTFPEATEDDIDFVIEEAL